MSKVKIAESTALETGGRLIVTIGDTTVGVFRTKNGLRAYENVCAHQGGPACQGRIMPAVRELLDDGMQSVGQAFDENEMHITCPWHGFEYLMDTGVHVTNPKYRLKKFEVEENGGQIYVTV